MSKKHSLHRRSHLLEGMPPAGRLPRKPLKTGTGPSTRDPSRTCRYSERVGLTEAELDAIAKRINSAGQGTQASGHIDPLLTASGAPSQGSLNKLLAQVAADVASDPPGRRDPHQEDADLFAPADSAVIDLGTTSWPGVR